MAVIPADEQHVPSHLPPRAGVEAYGSAVGDAVDGAFAVLAVSGALVRYAAEAAATGRRRVLARLPLAGQGRVLRRALYGPTARALAHPATTAVRAVSVAADQLVPEVARAVLARLDIPALVREYVDIDRLAAMLDVDAVVARVDLDAVMDRVDLDAVAAKLDLDAVVARLDLDTIVDKVDVSRVIDRVDLDSVVARVDLDRAVDRVDLDRAVDRVDIDRVLSRTDLAGLARYVIAEIDLPGLLRASTGSVTTEVVRTVRDQGADADRAVERVVDRLLRRQVRRTGPPGSDE
ncbi:hypothetical protein [Petropleomorpha daqingensis]|uniref:Uncharacterized protein n=1 Tax=Petropleomorpha daqingensis TaxID=2026353 RepID=A0A853CLX4_9ACTN|nr:hypothetical protein [Petropleomorpha daqingensis]NYJ07532.1 hypothetical protein [Petropleomorpha daqingensis]